MFVQRKDERDNDTQAYLQRMNKRDNVGYGNVTLAMVTVTFHFLWNRSPALPSCKELRSKSKKLKNVLKKRYGPSKKSKKNRKMSSISVTVLLKKK